MDNGIARFDGVAHAPGLGLALLETGHHLPAQGPLPAADVIVNPNQAGCGFASKALAGVGVMFYVLLAARAELRRRGRFGAAAQPRLDGLLDLVALGTVADVVRLDANNRRLVAQGLRRIRQGRLQAGVAALCAAARRDPSRVGAFDLGFAIAPRINAAGRLADMTLHVIGEDDLMNEVGAASQGHPDQRLIELLNREGRASCERWLNTPAAAPHKRTANFLRLSAEHVGVHGIL